ncbi:hypothetical protein H5410_038680 [Solanum commersonii]|uniref:Uncharacterized protein n=1 Tax=Solanum commersonii TaxID=4109 RepID=A0A9J5YCZ7_SOLCO|nr:hypothetical protein H5410_038680 [Solanum commersonii]
MAMFMSSFNVQHIPIIFPQQKILLDIVTFDQQSNNKTLPSSLVGFFLFQKKINWNLQYAKDYYAMLRVEGSRVPGKQKDRMKLANEANIS